MVFEVGDRVVDAVAGAAVPVDVEEVDLAARALLHELAEPGETGGGAAVGDGRGAEFGGPARELLHVCVPAGDGVGRGEVGAAVGEALVRFVEAEEVAGSRGDGGGGGRGPAVGVGTEAPEHGDEFELRGEAGGGGGPVVGPVDGGGGEGVG